MTALAFTVGKRGADPLTQIFSTLGVVQWEIDTCSLSWDTAPKTLEIQRDKSVFCMPMRRLVAGGPRMASGLGLIDPLHRENYHQPNLLEDFVPPLPTRLLVHLIVTLLWDVRNLMSVALWTELASSGGLAFRVLSTCLHL